MRSGTGSSFSKVPVLADNGLITKTYLHDLEASVRQRTPVAGANIDIKVTDGSFVIDNSLVEYNLNTISRPQYKTRLVYSDLNGDGLKDISYINSSITPYYMLQNNEMLTKSVFIRVGNKFVEKDYYQFDPYAKSLKDKYYK